MMKVYATDITELENNEELFSSIYFMLSGQRRERVDRFKSDSAKFSCMCAELLLMYALKEKGLTFKNIKYGFGENGKPYLPEYPDFFFNISHSGDKVILATSDSEIGCDIEKIRKNNTNLAARFFHPKESEQIDSVDSDQRTYEFFKIWTLKESYVKMLGQGLSKGLNNFNVLDEKLREEVFFKELVIYMGYKCSFCLKEEPQTCEFKKKKVSDIIAEISEAK